MVNRGETMVKGEFDFGFAVDWMRKDLRICLEEAKRNGADLPVTEIVAWILCRAKRRWIWPGMIHQA
jgi:3-hydroxyisobutyrate dehydrogenase-like beta-hydroxyacid dehydrogenase